MKARYFRKYFFMLPLVLLTAAGCNMEDLGNYDYTPAGELLPVEIAKFDGLPVPRPMGAVHYEPTFLKMDDEGRYEYKWYVIRTQEGMASVRTDLCETRNLDVEALPVPSGEYTLYFEVRDAAHDIFAKQSGPFSVTDSDLLNGFYILKDVGGNTDMDYFKYDKATDPLPSRMESYTDLISTGLGQPLAGSPRSMMWYGRGYFYLGEDDEGRLQTEAVPNTWMVMSDKHILALRNDFMEVYQQDGDFFPGPVTINPQTFCNVTSTTSRSPWMINDNNIYGIAGYMYHVGKWMSATKAGGLDFFPQFITGEDFAFGYDNNSGTFYMVSSYDGELLSVHDLIWEDWATDNIELILDMEVEPMAMLTGGGETPEWDGHGLMLMKHKTDAGKFYLSKIWSNGAWEDPFVWIRPIDAAADIVQTPAPVMVSSYVGQVVYYGKGSELWMYRDTGAPATLAQRQTRVATLGNGETVVYIMPVMFYDKRGTTPGENFNWVCVLTTTPGGGYKLYAFENDGPNPELKTTPGLLLEGTGNAKSFVARLRHML